MNRFVWTTTALATLALTASCTSLDSASDTFAALNGSGGSSGSGGTNQGTGGSSGIGGGTPTGMGGGGTGGSNVDLANWQCLTQPQPVAPMMTDAASRVTYVVPIVDFSSTNQMIVPVDVPDGDVMTVTPCISLDCETPAPGVLVVQGSKLPAPMTQPSYVWIVNTPYAFDNLFLRIMSTGYVTTDYILGGPMKGTPEGGSTVVGLVVPLLKTSQLRNLYSQIGLPSVDQTKGILALRTLDCQRKQVPPADGTRAAHVKVDANPATEGVKWVLSLGNTATTGDDQTDARGVAGFANVIPRSYRVNGVAPDGTIYGTTTLTARAGAITIGEIRDGIDRWGQ